MTGLRLQGVCKRYGSTPVLGGLDLSLAPGELVCLVGPSGCGKSTLLRLIAGLDRDYSGHIEAGTRLGMVFQAPRLMPWLNALDNVRLVLPAGEEGRRRARTALESVGLGEQLAAYPGQLSGGQQRRVALARAYAVEPQLLLLDEPFVSLDAPSAQRLRELLLLWWRASRATVLFVTHDLDEALGLADRIVFLGGRPARTVLELSLTAPRPRPPELRAQLQRDLLARHPHLLSGQANSGG
ncbi:MAG TPA: ABC transporter ATP-binding protein [Candidatus Competibacteraceae bacterium]|nr:ABC transporter ATP-binding protein [Candidatus Competibacteraceae bacterium]